MNLLKPALADFHSVGFPRLDFLNSDYGQACDLDGG